MNTHLITNCGECPCNSDAPWAGECLLARLHARDLQPETSTQKVPEECPLRGGAALLDVVRS